MNPFRPSRIPSRVKQFLLSCLVVLVSVIVVLGVMEGAVRLGAVGWLRRVLRPSLASAPMHLPSERLGHRPNPQWPGHDQRGWRNPTALESAEVVALGDSQTYGIGAQSSESWPSRLAVHTGHAVYQMAFGGYGPGHYLELVEGALALKPKVVLAPLYFGNDVLDTYWFAYNLESSGFGRRADSSAYVEFRSKSSTTLESLGRAEAVDPQLIRQRYMDCQSPRRVPDIRLHRGLNILESAPLGPLAGKSLWGKIAESSQLAQVVEGRLAALGPFRPVPEYGPPLCLRTVGERRELSTLLTPGYRLLALTDTDPRVVEGKRIILEVFDRLNEKIQAGKARMVVVLIPTKELVFEGVPVEPGADDFYLREVRREERRYRSEVTRYLTRSKIPFIDLLPELRRSLAAGVNPYSGLNGNLHDEGDGHPRAAGYDVMARTIARDLLLPKEK